MNGQNERSALQVECEDFAGRTPPPCLMVIFGASGDLTQRSLLPSVFELELKGLLPERFTVLGYAQEAWSDEVFRVRMQEAAKKCSGFDARRWDGFASRLHYLPGDFSELQDYHSLKQRIVELQCESELPDNVFFHLAAPPAFFGVIAENLKKGGLAHSGQGWRRLVIEKPFGEDRESACALHRNLRASFDEEQIYRIDHFLGKETVQNMLVFRFANPSFEPVWNHRFIDHVQITVAEKIGVGIRGAFYENTGVVRDMIQNHLLQLLCMTAMEPPVAYNPQSLRDETIKVLRAIQAPEPDA
jgi:glucose-6-phosphate 1-dehydrogenase